MKERKGSADLQDPLLAAPRQATIAREEGSAARACATSVDESVIREWRELDTARESEVHLRVDGDEVASKVAALQRERRLAHDIFEAAPEAYLLSDASGRILRANRRASELLRTDPCFLRHKPLIGFVAREDRARFLQLIIKTAANRGPSRQEVHLRPRDSRGSVACLACVARAANESSDHALRWIFCELPSSMTSQTHEPSQLASHEGGPLFVQVSQELRAQLSSVLGWLQIVRQNVSDHEAGLRAIASITRAVRSAISVADRIADYARLEREDMPLECVRIALPELVGQLVDEMRVVAQQRGFRLSAVLRGAVPGIVGDPRQLQLALRRVLYEVARSTAPGGEVFVSVAPTGGRAVMTIRSTGCGIDHSSEMDVPAPAIDSDIARAHRCLKLHGATIQTEPAGPDGHSKIGISFPRVSVAGWG